MQMVSIMWQRMCLNSVRLGKQPVKRKQKQKCKKCWGKSRPGDISLHKKASKKYVTYMVQIQEVAKVRKGKERKGER